MAELRLVYIDEIIEARRAQQGGNRGAPPILDGEIRVGASLNRSCIVLISALMQAYIEDVFEECLPLVFSNMREEGRRKKYLKEIKHWGNPNPEAINRLFFRLGVENVLNGLTWQRCSNNSVTIKLDTLNKIRNRIAHGSDQIFFDNMEYNLTLPKVINFRNFADAFGQRFEDHAKIAVRAVGHG